MTQAEIAARLNMTRQRVNQIIGMLVDLGVVEIRINGLQGDNTVLESRFEKALNLKRVFIIEPEDEFDPLESFGQQAAEALECFLRDGITVGVSWGATLGATVSKISTQKLSKSIVVQLVGGLNSQNPATKSDEIARALALRLGCDSNLLYAPAIVESEAAREVIVNDGALGATMALIDRCDLALLGIGELGQTATIYRQGYITEEQLKTMVAEGYVGDMAMHHFRADGQWVEANTVIGVDPKTLGKIPTVVGLASGENKWKAVLGAVRTGVLNVLVIDKSIALKLAQEYNLNTDEA